MRVCVCMCDCVCVCVYLCVCGREVCVFVYVNKGKSGVISPIFTNTRPIKPGTLVGLREASQPSVTDRRGRVM